MCELGIIIFLRIELHMGEGEKSNRIFTIICFIIYELRVKIITYVDFAIRLEIFHKWS